MTSPKSSSGKPSPTSGGHTPGGNGTGRSSSPITATNSNTRVAAGRIATAKKTAGSRIETPARATNSNTRVLTRGGVVAQPVLRNTDNPGMNSSRLRDAMVARLRKAGITDELVLSAMQAIPRHHFIDEALASRAYEDASLPIGHGQTISQPWIVARMIQAARANRTLTRVLEVGTGCGYQAAVLGGVAQEVYSIERIRALHDFARDRLRPLRLTRVRLALGDGMLGLPSAAPFDAIVVAAAGMAIPDALSEQLAIGGRLVAPEGTTEQRLILIERTGARNWKRSELESVRFVPLRPGVIW